MLNKFLLFVGENLKKWDLFKLKIFFLTNKEKFLMQ